MKIGIVKSKFIEVGLKGCVGFVIGREWKRKHSKKARHQEEENKTKHE